MYTDGINSGNPEYIFTFISIFMFIPYEYFFRKDSRYFIIKRVAPKIAKSKYIYIRII